MEFWICTLLFIAAAGGCVTLALAMKHTERKRGCMLPTLLLGLLALALLAYLGLTLFFVDSIP